jgi:hypothetical protein
MFAEPAARGFSFAPPIFLISETTEKFRQNKAVKLLPWSTLISHVSGSLRAQAIGPELGGPRLR